MRTQDTNALKQRAQKELRWLNTLLQSSSSVYAINYGSFLDCVAHHPNVVEHLLAPNCFSLELSRYEWLKLLRTDKQIETFLLHPILHKKMHAQDWLVLAKRSEVALDYFIDHLDVLKPKSATLAEFASISDSAYVRLALKGALDQIHPSDLGVLNQHNEQAAKTYLQQKQLKRAYKLNILGYHPTLCLQWLEQEIKLRKPLTDDEVRSIAHKLEPAKTLLEKSYWREQLSQQQWALIIAKHPELAKYPLQHFKIQQLQAPLMSAIAKHNSQLSMFLYAQYQNDPASCVLTLSDWLELSKHQPELALQLYTDMANQSPLQLGALFQCALNSVQCLNRLLKSADLLNQLQPNQIVELCLKQPNSRQKILSDSLLKSQCLSCEKGGQLFSENLGALSKPDTSESEMPAKTMQRIHHRRRIVHTIAKHVESLCEKSKNSQQEPGALLPLFTSKTLSRPAKDGGDVLTPTRKLKG